jgi:hypothetical protein
VNCKEVSTQAELDALSADECPHLVGSGYFTVSGNATVRAEGNATVEAGGSATVRAEDSATVEAWAETALSPEEREAIGI